MQVKPTQQEEEHFARLEFERRRKVLNERKPRRPKTGFLGGRRRIFT